MDSKQSVNVTINKPVKMLYFSDGVEEVIEEREVEGLESQPDSSHVDPKTLPWAPWLSHYAWKSGSKVLNVVDYAGESLASFFGITTPKYQLEIEEYERMTKENRKTEEEAVGWVPMNKGDVPLVLNEPITEEHNHEPPEKFMATADTSIQQKLLPVV